MAIHLKAFKIELYEEHLEEASFLYETRLAWSNDEEIGWMDLEDLDNRIEAHIDALIVGENLALTVCLDRLEEAEASELHIIVRVICRYKLVKQLSKLWETFDFDDEEKIKAVSDALTWECPQEWLKSLQRAFISKRVKLFPVLTPCTLRLSIESPDIKEALFSVLPQLSEKYQIEVLDNLLFTQSKLSQKELTLIRSYTNNGNKNLAESAVKLLLCNHDIQTQSLLQNKPGFMPVLSALSCGRTIVKVLIRLASDGKADANVLLAIGLMGESASIPYLLSYLKHPDLASQAALALHLITGAELFDDVHVPENMEEAELFEHELEAFKSGELPKNIDGLPFGEEVSKLSIDVAAWEKWLDTNGNTYEDGHRYRYGKKFSIDSLLRALFTNKTPWAIRKYAYLECVIRYSLNVSFFDLDLVESQKKKLNEIYFWAQGQETFISGRWYFASKDIFN